jgi:glutamate racemase
MTIGLFDSGVGGLSVWRVLRQMLPSAPLLYVADQAHVPYGTRPPAEIRQLSEAITRFLLAEGAELVVVACNTATAAALSYLREQFPQVAFVGMEPAIKPAVALSQTGVIGVLATANTFQSQRYASLLARFAQGVRLLEDPCVGLVELIEAGELSTAVTRAHLQQIISPMLAQGADTLILGCTHYPFIQPLLRELVGEQVQIIDPATAVVRQISRLYQPHTNPNQPITHPASQQFYTTGNPNQLAHAIHTLLHLPPPPVTQLISQPTANGWELYPR